MSVGFNKGGVKFDGVTYLKNTWYKIEEATCQKKEITLINQGVDNLLDEGTVFLSIRTDALVETGAVTGAGIIPLFPGDSFAVTYDTLWSHPKSIWAQADTDNLVIYWEYNEERP